MSAVPRGLIFGSIKLIVKFHSPLVLEGPDVRYLRALPRRWIWVTAFSLLASTFQLTALAADNEIMFGLVPALSPEVMVQRYQPLAKHLSDEIGVPVRLVSAPDYGTYMNRVLEGSKSDMIIAGGDSYRLAER